LLEHPRTAFFDIGAVVYFLRPVPWIVPGFTAASRMLIEATRP